MASDQDQYGNYRANLGPVPPNPTPTYGYIQLVAGNPTSLGTTGPAGSFAFDTVGLVLYYTADGSTWTASSGSGATTQVYSGTGDPNGVVTATAPALYYDTNSGILYQKTGSGNTGWN